MRQAITLLAHRGLWSRPAEKNTYAAIEAALARGFGIEIDVRDQGDMLMVAHDVDEDGAYPFADLAPLFRKAPGACVAINVKSCGLQALIADALKKNNIASYFTFDMAVPDMLGNISAGLVSYTRQSEIEPDPVLYDKTQGVWMDMFEREWITADDIMGHLARGRDVALVSPELHRRPHEAFWAHLKDNEDAFAASGRPVYLCTDYPEDAARYFHG